MKKILFIGCVESSYKLLLELIIHHKNVVGVITKEESKFYDTEIEEVPFPRSLENIRALAAVRGGYCTSRYAEAFCIIKQIE